ncbi:hypothetical protein KEM52_005531 [Ascosphaera acerosa]|nr:hypothetical protein KEM52_005531 [Ascosphaera acerosa]
MFTGLNVTRFLSKFDDLCDEYGLDEAQRLRKLPLYCNEIIGDQIAYMHGYLASDYKALKSSFLRDFRRQDRAQTVYTFAYLEQICQRMRSDEEYLEEFVREYSTVSAALRKAKKMEEYTQCSMFVDCIPQILAWTVRQELHLDVNTPEKWVWANILALVKAEIGEWSLHLLSEATISKGGKMARTEMFDRLRSTTTRGTMEGPAEARCRDKDEITGQETLRLTTVLTMDVTHVAIIVGTKDTMWDVVVGRKKICPIDLCIGTIPKESGMLAARRDQALDSSGLLEALCAMVSLITLELRWFLKGVTQMLKLPPLSTFLRPLTNSSGPQELEQYLVIAIAQGQPFSEVLSGLEGANLQALLAANEALLNAIKRKAEEKLLEINSRKQGRIVPVEESESEEEKDVDMADDLNANKQLQPHDKPTERRISKKAPPKGPVEEVRADTKPEPRKPKTTTDAVPLKKLAQSTRDATDTMEVVRAMLDAPVTLTQKQILGMAPKTLWKQQSATLKYDSKSRSRGFTITEIKSMLRKYSKFM